MNREEELLNIIKELKKVRSKLKQKINARKWEAKNKQRRTLQKAQQYLNNREEIRKRHNQWNLDNPNYNREYGKKHREENSEYHKKRHFDYQNTEAGKKCQRKSTWKMNGLNMENFEEIYKRYLETTNCDNCNILLTCGKLKLATTKCMDHSHITGEFRNVLCLACNTRRGENNL
tara:strand:- start:777 stop:1301 length:525 start_codon:yes stop_codon:yes gene_type:complete